MPLAPEVQAEYNRVKDMVVVPLKIAAPPCPDCIHWRPVADSDGLTLCHSPDMFSDFACYKPKVVPAMTIEMAKFLEP